MIGSPIAPAGSRNGVVPLRSNGETRSASDSRPRTGQVWEYISPSRLNLWMKCPLAFKLRYIDGIQSPTTPALFLGQQVHAGLESYYRHRMLGVKLSAEAVATRMLSTWDEAAVDRGFIAASKSDDSKLREQAARLVSAYIAQVPPGEPAPLAVEARLEAPLVDPFTGVDLGINLMGIADLVLPSPDGPVIIDFKTAARASKPLEIVHEIQLGCYAFMLRSLTGEEESAIEIRSLVKTKTPKIAYSKFGRRSDSHLRRLFAVIHEYLDCLRTGRFTYRPGWTCGMCDYQKECAAHSCP